VSSAYGFREQRLRNPFTLKRSSRKPQAALTDFVRSACGFREERATTEGLASNPKVGASERAIYRIGCHISLAGPSGLPQFASMSERACNWLASNRPFCERASTCVGLFVSELRLASPFWTTLSQPLLADSARGCLRRPQGLLADSARAVLAEVLIPNSLRA